jgi:hypothetical protein
MRWIKDIEDCMKHGLVEKISWYLWLKYYKPLNKLAEFMANIFKQTLRFLNMNIEKILMLNIETKKN